MMHIGIAAGHYEFELKVQLTALLTPAIRETLIYAPYSLEEGQAAIRRLDDAVALPSLFGPSSAHVPFQPFRG